MREMTYTSSIPHTNVSLRSTAKQTPWLAFAFLSTVFFLTSHDLGQAKRGMDEYNLTRDELVSRSEEGPPARRVALVVLGISGIVSLIRSPANAVFMRKVSWDGHLSRLLAGHFLARRGLWTYP